VENKTHSKDIRIWLQRNLKNWSYTRLTIIKSVLISRKKKFSHTSKNWSRHIHSMYLWKEASNSQAVSFQNKLKKLCINMGMIMRHSILWKTKLWDNILNFTQSGQPSHRSTSIKSLLVVSIFSKIWLKVMN